MMRHFTLSVRHSLQSKAFGGWATALLAVLLGTTPVLAQVDSGYSMTVEEYAVHDAGDLAGMTTYRFYINMANETDFLSSIFGNEDNPFYINTSTGFYNDGFATGSTADGVNPSFFGFFPTLEFDSYATIGIEGSPTPPYTAISAVESTLQPWIGCFNAMSPLSGTDVAMDDFTGGAWYVLNGTPNGLPDPTTMRVLFLQLTTSGTISGTINAQVFPFGIGADQQQLTYSFDGVGEVTAAVDGCTDEAACNYDAEATADDGSCEFPEAGYDCDGNCVNDADMDGICDENEIPGCEDATACNYDAAATDDDGSCTYAEAGYDCDGNCLNDADMDGICDENEVPGCTDMAACNYDAAATDDDASCTYPTETYLDCAGACLNDSDGDGICDELETDGCTDMAACNYAPNATTDDGSCTYAEAGYDCDGNCLSDSDMDGVCDEFDPCSDMMACNYDLNNDNCEFPDAGYDCEGACLNDADGDGTCDEFEIAGCTDAMACNYAATATDDDGSCTYAEAGYDCAGVCLNDADMDGVYDEFEVAGCDDEGACNYDPAATEDDGSCTYPETGYDCAGACLNDADMDGVCDEFEVAGCDDAMACNYDMAATDDDGSCTYPEAGYDCDGACLADADMDGVCDEYEVSGCQDTNACNYDMDATDDDGSCIFPEAGYDCDGICLNDADMDGVCDEFEVVGCSDEAACNYDMNATDEGDCIYAETGYDCEGNCLNDMDMDGICDEFEVAGCTDEAAPNYNPEATDDDGSCITCDLVAEAVVTDALCAGDANGMVDIAVTDNTGEAGALTYTLGDTTQDDAMFSGLAAGDYSVEVTAANGCSTTVEFTIAEPEALTITVDAVGDETEAGVGSIEVTVTGGTAPYVFAWTGDNDFTSADEDLSGLVAGVYVLNVYDDHQCATEVEVEVDDVLSVATTDALLWAAYPNPANASLWIAVNADVPAATVRATDMQGRVVMSEEATVINGLLEMNVAGWSAGTYLVHVTAADAVWTTQIVVRH